MIMMNSIEVLKSTFYKPLEEVSDNSYLFTSLKGRFLCVKELFIQTHVGIGNLIFLVGLVSFGIFRTLGETISGDLRQAGSHGIDTLDAVIVLALFPVTTSVKLSRCVLGSLIHPGIALGHIDCIVA